MCVAALQHAISPLLHADCACVIVLWLRCALQLRKVPKQRTLLDLDLLFYQVENELQAELTYNASVFEEETARRFADSLQVGSDGLGLNLSLLDCGGTPASRPCCRDMYREFPPHTQELSRLMIWLQTGVLQQK